MSLEERTDGIDSAARLEKDVLSYLGRQGVVSFGRMRKDLSGYRPGLLQRGVEQLSETGRVQRVTNAIKRDDRYFARVPTWKYVGVRIGRVLGTAFESASSTVKNWYYSYGEED